MSHLYRIALVATLAQIAAAQPGIQQNGVLNSASQIPPTLAGGSIARGALFEISGVRLGSPGHTTVTVSRNGVAAKVSVISVAPRRIQAQMPLTAPLGSASLTVTVDRQTSKAFSVEVAASNPGIYSRNLEGWGPGRIENIADGGARSPNTPSDPARPGQRVAFATTGMGSARRIGVMIGNRMVMAGPPARGSRQGEEEIAFKIPSDAPLGCWVPLYLQVTPERASNVVTISVAAPGTPCDPGPFPFLPGQRIGVVALSRTRIKAQRANTADARIDEARVLFQSVSKDMAPSPLRLLPPPGTCTTYTSSYQANAPLSETISSVVTLEGAGLDAGANLVVRRGNQSRAISRVWATAGTYRGRLGVGGFAARNDSPQLFLEPGEFVLAGAGGKDVRSFSASFPFHPAFEWIDRDQINAVERRRGVAVRWRNPSHDDLMIILARNVDEITTAIGMCLCTARASGEHFAIPPALLANVPVSHNVTDSTLDELALGSVTTNPATLSRVPGLDRGFIYAIHVNGRTVNYQ